MADPDGPRRPPREEVEGEGERIPAEKTSGGEKTMLVVVAIVLLVLVAVALILPHSPMASE